MFRHLSENMKKLLIESLCKRYDNTNRKLQGDFVRMHYEKYEIECMEDELKRISEIIEELKNDNEMND